MYQPPPTWSLLNAVLCLLRVPFLLETDYIYTWSGNRVLPVKITHFTMGILSPSEEALCLQKQRVFIGSEALVNNWSFESGRYF